MNLVHGFGINDADYNVYITGSGDNGKRKVIWVCPFYRKWIHMLERCYDQKLHNKFPTYVGCSVCKDWKSFSTFKAWMETQNWEGKHLDKDLLIKGNKIYSPNTCVFLDARINTFLTESGACRGKFPIGVSLERESGKYVAQCWSIELGKNKKIGRFKTPEEAHKAWLAFKLEQAYTLAAQQTDERVAKALVERYENYTN